MATITKRGDSYRIKVSCGYDVEGKQVTQSMTWRPDPGMTPNQIKKELNRQAVLFEEECSHGKVTANIKFETFAEQWFREYNKNIASSQKKLTLMHNPSDLDKVGSESVKGNISGTLGYNAKVAGLGAEITMPYTNYADHFISDDSTLGIKFILDGNTDTTSNMSANGHMHETVHCFSRTIDVTDAAQIEKAFENLSEPAKNTIKNTGDKNYLCGMYPGYAIYNNLEIKGGAAGGGYYLVQTFELDRKDKNSGTVVLAEDKVNWLVGEEK